MVTKIYIVRHAEAEGNIYRRSHGWYDAYLTDTGLRQVDNLARRMKGIHLDAIYSSDLRRTMMTAEAPRRASGLPVIPEPGLRELQMGDWENYTWGNCMQEDYDLAASFAQNDAWRAPGAESVCDLIERTTATVRRLAARHEGGAICLVSHSVAIRAMLTGFGIYRDIGECGIVPNASLSLIECEDGAFRPVFIGSNEHNASVPQHSAHPMGGGVERPTLWFRAARRDESGVAAELWGEAWSSVYGNLRMFDPGFAELRVGMMIEDDPDAVRLAFCGDELAGVLILDRFADERGVMHIVLFMLREKFRGYGLAVQLVGEAVTCARLAGKDTLRLRVAKKNKHAIELYEKNGFSTAYKDSGDLVMKRTVLPAEVLTGFA